MWAIQIVGSLNKVYQQFKTYWGEALHVLNYRQVHGVWKSVGWSSETVVKTAIVTPSEGGSIELTDLIIATDKTTNATVVITFEDGTNTETLITGDTTNDSLVLSLSVAGRLQAWKNASLNYTVAGGNSTGSIIVGYVRREPADTEDYSVWNSRR